MKKTTKKTTKTRFDDVLQKQRATFLRLIVSFRDVLSSENDDAREREDERRDNAAL